MALVPREAKQHVFWGERIHVPRCDEAEDTEPSQVI